MEPDLNRASRDYSDRKYFCQILALIYSFFLLVIFAASGLSAALRDTFLNFTGGGIFYFPLYFLTISLAWFILGFPLNFYQSFILEHKFSLSKQKIGAWLLDQIKAGILSFIIGLVLIGVFYQILGRFPRSWWVFVSLAWIFFSVLFAKLFPLIVIPLFFKYKPLADERLKQRIILLAQKMRIKLLDCFEIDFSKKTLKANAAFVGWGKSRRVILADTLKEKYSHDEIEIILAHEFAHYRLRHLFKLILFNSAASALIFFVIFKTSAWALGLFKLDSLTDIAALPLVFIYFLLFGAVLAPVENYFSRRLEKNADMMALEITGAPQPFISMMDKLAGQNLADRKPNPFIKLCFFDHPPIDERISMALTYSSESQ